MAPRLKRAENKLICPRGLWHVFIDNPLPPDDPDYNPFLGHLSRIKWKKYKAEVLAYWIEKYPGTRPSRFWIFEIIGPTPKTEKGKLNYLKKHGYLTEYELKTLKIRQK